MEYEILVNTYSESKELMKKLLENELGLTRLRLLKNRHDNKWILKYFIASKTFQEQYMKQRKKVNKMYC